MRRPSLTRGVAVVAALAVVTGGPAAAAVRRPAPASGGHLSLVSVSRAGVSGTGLSDGSRISADGRFVTFSSSAPDLVPGDTNGTSDVFVRDLRTGTTTRVSLSSANRQGNGPSWRSAISAGGRYVAFGSSASNLVPGDTNATHDVFVRDRRTGVTTRVNLTGGRRQANGFSSVEDISADGRYVLFGTNATNLTAGRDANGGNPDSFVRDRRTGRTTLVDVSTSGVQANAYASGAAISADGRYVTFTSQASNLVPGDTNGVFDVFVRDLRRRTTTRVSLPTRPALGTQGNHDSYARAMSPDGRFIAFVSEASNLVSGDTNGTGDIFVRDRRAGTTSRVSLSSTGAQLGGYSSDAAISADGRYVVFSTSDDGVVPGDTNHNQDVFLRDRRSGRTRMISVSDSGVQGDNQSLAGSMSANGRDIVFISEASTLVPGDTNGSFDVFRYHQ
jgi:Tol biopolymer transport system component